MASGAIQSRVPPVKLPTTPFRASFRVADNASGDPDKHFAVTAGLTARDQQCAFSGQMKK